jgi:2'-5' RNA ligase
MPPRGAAAAMRRVFLGLDLPAEVRSALAVQQFLLPLPKKAPVEQLHLTLVFVAAAPDDALEAAHEAWSALQIAPFPLQLQGLGLFGGDRPRAVWAGLAPSEPLMRLQAKVEQAARRAGLDPEHRRFSPHVTLGHFRPPGFAETAALERAVAGGAGFTAGPWQVTEMCLWQSHLTPQGARHDLLARYPFS